jgi:hypothetical protein
VEVRGRIPVEMRMHFDVIHKRQLTKSMLSVNMKLLLMENCSCGAVSAGTHVKWLSIAAAARYMWARAPLELQLHGRPLACEGQDRRVAQRHGAGDVPEARLQARAVGDQRRRAIAAEH